MATHSRPALVSTPQSPQRDSTEDNIDLVIDLLKRYDALSQDSFINNLPFFTLAPISKERQILELFQNSCDLNSYRALLKNITPLPQDTDLQLLKKKFNPPTMTFAQVCLYKVLPCPNHHCINRPREIVTHNQYKDSEYRCPFYHHERDRRRLVITSTLGEEFEYKASYYEEGRNQAFKEKYSQNYFESMFHPIYYKLFRCKKESCNSCQFCPFFHSEQEKKAWDSMFSNFMKKERIFYVKDKQKYYENSSSSSPSTQGSVDEDQYQSPCKTTSQSQKRHLNQKEHNSCKYSPNKFESPNSNSSPKNSKEIKSGNPYQNSSQKKRRFIKNFDSGRKQTGVIQA